MRRTLALALFALAAPAFADPPLAVPAGFTIAKVAGPPLVTFPVAGSFDDRGRLYVVDVAGPVARDDVQARKPLHRIVCLEDADGDGTFDKAIPFADKLPFPEGCLYHAGSVYTACPPHILKLTDADGDGVADTREVWFDGKTLTGCANDLHGPYRGPDGYLYWTKGAFAKWDVTLGTGQKFTTRAAHVFRAKPDGSGLEVVMTGGMDNPVGVAFTASGDVIVSNTFLQHPADGKRDGLIHAVPGGVWGKDHDPIYEHPWTSPKLMPVMTHLGPAAPAGIRRYESDQLGQEYQDNLFCAQFNLRKVSSHKLVPTGSTYRTIDRDFVTSTDPDFHPTDVIQDADGSLLVIDTGGWYKLCCPSSQLVKADAVGGIYRVKKAGGHTQELRPNRPLAKPPTEGHSLRQWAETATTADVPRVLQILASTTGIDPHLEAALTAALIRGGDADAVAKGLSDAPPAQTRACLMALEQIDPKRLSADAVIGFFDAGGELTATAVWVARRHPEWARAVAAFYRANPERLQIPEQRQLRPVSPLPFVGWEPVQLVVAQATRGGTPGRPAYLPFQIMLKSGLKELPVVWAEVIREAVRPPGDIALRPEALKVARAFPPPKNPPKGYRDAFLAVADRRTVRDSDRLTALAAVPGDPPPPQDSFLTLVVKNLHADKPAGLRLLAAEAAGKVPWTPDQLAALAAAVKTVTPLELDRLLAIFKKSADESVGLALVAALSEPKVRAAIRSEQVKPILDKYPAAVKAEAAKLYAVLDAEVLKQREKLESLSKDLPAGDVSRGHKVFNGAKAACATCHTIGYVGGKTGPDLTKIGGIRTERDLLESIVFPSLSFVRSYEPVAVVTLDGRQFSGIVKKDGVDEVVLVTAADKEERIARDNVESLKPGTVSVMPAGLDQQLSKQELADLVAFLRASK